MYESEGADANLMNADFDYLKTVAEHFGRNAALLLNKQTREIVNQVLSEESQNSEFANVIVSA